MTQNDVFEAVGLYLNFGRDADSLMKLYVHAENVHKDYKEGGGVYPFEWFFDNYYDWCHRGVCGY